MSRSGASPGPRTARAQDATGDGRGPRGGRPSTWMPCTSTQYGQEFPAETAVATTSLPPGSPSPGEQRLAQQQPAGRASTSGAASAEHGRGQHAEVPLHLGVHLGDQAARRAGRTGETWRTCEDARRRAGGASGSLVRLSSGEVTRRLRSYPAATARVATWAVPATTVLASAQPTAMTTAFARPGPGRQTANQDSATSAITSAVLSRTPARSEPSAEPGSSELDAGTRRRGEQHPRGQAVAHPQRHRGARCGVARQEQRHAERRGTARRTVAAGPARR